MKIVWMPWGAWYGDKQHAFAFPDSWAVSVHEMRDGLALGSDQIEAVLSSSVDWKGLTQRAKSIRKVAIAVDDLSRPTPTWRLLPSLLRRLGRSGIDRERVRILVAIGAHRVLTRADLVRKLGRETVTEIEVSNHSPFSNLLKLGTSSRGISMEINRHFVEADFKVGIGCLLPHSEAGFSGGAKIVLPGLAGIDTIEQYHKLRSTPSSLESDKTGVVAGNEIRMEIEEVARKAGLDLSVNVVVNSRRGIAGLFVGDPVEAHRKAVELAKRIYATRLPDQVDVAIFNAYPKDTEFDQVVNALHLIHSARRLIVHEEGTIVLTTAASEGRGFGYLFGSEGRLPYVFDPVQMIGGRRLLIYSTRANQPDLLSIFPTGAELFGRWDRLTERLRGLHGENCRVAVFPYASNQIALKQESGEGATC